MLNRDVLWKFDFWCCLLQINDIPFEQYDGQMQDRRRFHNPRGFP